MTQTKKTIIFVTLAFLLGGLAYVGTMMAVLRAYGQLSDDVQVVSVERKPLYVFVMNDDDNGSLSEQVKAGMALPDPSGMKDYLLSYDIKVIPFGSGIKNLADIEKTTLPALRAIPEYKDSLFVFVYQPEMTGQF